MQTDITTLILTEVQALRTEVSANAVATGERLAKLEAQMYSLCGNGQPGRISLLESAVSKLQQWRWWVVGATAGISGVVSVIAWAVMAVKK